MKLIVAAVGKPRHAALAAVIEEYETRAARYWPLEVREVREESGRGGNADTVREKEAERLASRTEGASLVACDEGGTAMSSTRFAAFLRDARERARDVAFIIGGAYGLAPSIRDGAQTRLSLAPW